RDEAGVGPVVVAEVVVARVLTAEHGVGVGHDLLDERVADTRPDGLPPFSWMTSGTIQEQIRLWTIFAPGCFSSMERATSAVMSDPLTPSARSSTKNTRSASPSNARPMSAPCSCTARRRSFWLSGSMGSAGWFG